MKSIVGLRLQCGVVRNAEDVYFISAYAPVHDERTQTSTSEALRIEFWRKLDGVIRQVRSRCRVILCMDTTLPWIGSPGSRIREKWTRTAGGVEIESTCVNLDTRRSQSSMLDLALAFQDPTPPGLHDHTPN